MKIAIILLILRFNEDKSNHVSLIKILDDWFQPKSMQYLYSIQDSFFDNEYYF